MLLTFSRRAAAEMTRRVDLLLSEFSRGRGLAICEPLSWAGTFHAIGARLLREYAETIGLAAAFTIHDREDSADLINLVRYDLGYSKMEKRFPAKSTCLAIYSRVVNSERKLDDVLGRSFPWCACGPSNCGRCSRIMSRPNNISACSIMTILLLYWAHMMEERAIAAEIAAPLRPRAGRRISGHQRAAGKSAAGAAARRYRPDGGRRRRAIDLFVPRRDRAQYPRFSRSTLHRGRRW